MVIVLCFHAHKHGWQRLNGIADLIYMISIHSNLKWQDVIVRAEKMGAKRIVLTELFLAHKYGNVSYGSEIENLIASDASMVEIASEIQLNIF
jgi:hypothetical protein